MKKIALLAAMAVVLTAAQCEEERVSTGAKREQKATQLLLDQASTIVGMPAVKNFTEKRMMKMLYELRDSADLVTYTYYVDLNGRRHKVCPGTSIGYGVPYSAQYTAPQSSLATKYYNAGVWAPFQPEPNGLYMPDSSSATWVMCMDPTTKEPTPVYVEPLIIVSTFPMKSAE